MILANVKGLTDPRHRPESAANYYLKLPVFNALDFGLLSDRERVFIVGIRRDINQGQNFQFPPTLNEHSQLFNSEIN